MERIDRTMRPEVTKAQEVIWDKFVEDGYAVMETPIEEVPKSPEVIESVKQSLEIDRKYLREYLGLEMTLDINPEKDVLLAKNGMTHVLQDGKKVETYRRAGTNFVGFIILDHRMASQVLTHDLSHEIFHALGVRKKRLAISPHRSTSTNISVDIIAKLGYQAHRGDEGERMVGFNEAVTERMAREAIRDYADSIPEGERERVLRHPANETSYVRDRIVLDEIVSHVSEVDDPHNPYAAEIFWKKIAKGAFLGTKMHLREIEKVYGKGALNVLAAMTPLEPIDKLEPGMYDNDLFVRFFSGKTSQMEREQIKNEILGNPKEGLRA